MSLFGHLLLWSCDLNTFVFIMVVKHDIQINELVSF